MENQDQKPEDQKQADVPLTPSHLAQLNIERQTLFMNDVMKLAEANHFDVIELVTALKTILAVHFIEHEPSFYRTWLKALEKEYRGRKQRRHIDALREKIAEKMAQTEGFATPPEGPSTAPELVEEPEKEDFCSDCGAPVPCNSPHETAAEAEDAGEAGKIVEIQVENQDAAREWMEHRGGKAAH